MQRPAQSYSSAQLMSCVHRRDTAACSTEQAVHTFLGLFEASSVIIVSYCSDHYHHLLHLYFLPTARLILDLTERSISPPHPSKEWRWFENIIFMFLVKDLPGIGLSPRGISRFSIFLYVFRFFAFYKWDFLRSFMNFYFVFHVLCIFMGFYGFLRPF